MNSLIPSLCRNGIAPSREELFQPFESYFNSLFDNFFHSDGLMSIKSRVGYPKLDVLTENGHWVVEVALPGVRPEEVTVEIMPAKDHGNPSILKISGRMAEDHQYEKATYHVKELRRSSFERSLVLPQYVKGEPDASMRNGILRLSWEVPDLKVPEKKTVKIRTEE